jgi:hypothetical protein
VDRDLKDHQRLFSEKFREYRQNLLLHSWTDPSQSLIQTCLVNSSQLIQNNMSIWFSRTCRGQP